MNYVNDSNFVEPKDNAYVLSCTVKFITIVDIVVLPTDTYFYHIIANSSLDTVNNVENNKKKRSKSSLLLILSTHCCYQIMFLIFQILIKCAFSSFILISNLLGWRHLTYLNINMHRISLWKPEFTANWQIYIDQSFNSSSWYKVVDILSPEPQ